MATTRAKSKAGRQGSEQARGHAPSSRGKSKAVPKAAPTKSKAAKQAPAKKRGKHATAAGAPGTSAAAAAAAAPAAGGGSQLVVTNRAPVLTLWAAVVAQREGYSWEEGLTFGRYIAGVLAHSKGKALGLYEDREVSEEEREDRRRREEEAGVERVRVFGMKCPALLVSGRAGLRGGCLNSMATTVLPGSGSVLAEKERHLLAMPVCMHASEPPGHPGPWLAQVDGQRRAVHESQAIEPSSVQASLRRSLGVRFQDTKVWAAAAPVRCPATPAFNNDHRDGKQDAPQAMGGQTPAPCCCLACPPRRQCASQAAMEELAGAIPAARIPRVAYKLYEQFRPEWKGWGVKSQLDLQTIRGLAATWQEEA